MIRLALLRHGHTRWNREGRIQGRTDIPLDPEAEAQLAALMLPGGWQEASVCSSPLSRAAETARLITGRAPLRDPALTEMNWGSWEGERPAALRAAGVTAYKDIEDWGWHFRPPQGESPAEVAARLAPWLDGLTRDTLAVCHIGIMRVLLARATGWHFDGPAPFQVKRNRLYILHLADGTLILDPDQPRLRDRAG